MQDPLTLSGHDWIATVVFQFFDGRNFPLLNTEFPFIPEWQDKELEDWQNLPQGILCDFPLDNRRKKARIPEKGWQCGFRIEPSLFPPDGRSVQVKIDETDTVADVLKKISNDWPGLRGRDYHPPAPNSLQLRKLGGRVYFPDEIVEKIGYEFKSPGFCVERRDEAETVSSTMYRRASTGVKEATASMVPPPPPPPASSPIDPSLARLLTCSDNLFDLRSSLFDERRRFQQKLVTLEAALNDESDKCAALGETLGSRFKADRDDLKQQIAVLREQISKSALEAIE